MIPMFMTVRVQWFRLWVPLVIVWVLLLPVVLVLLPVAFLVCLIVQINPLRAGKVFWQVLSGLSGTIVDVNDGEHVVAIRIY